MRVTVIMILAIAFMVWMAGKFIDHSRSQLRQTVEMATPRE